MENFLLAVIIVMMLVIILLVKLMQLIMSFNPYFHTQFAMPPAVAPRRPRRRGGGGATVIFVMLLIIALFWLSNPEVLRENRPSIPEQQGREWPMPPVGDTSRDVREPAPRSLRQLEPAPEGEACLTET